MTSPRVSDSGSIIGTFGTACLCLLSAWLVAGCANAVSTGIGEVADTAIEDAGRDARITPLDDISSDQEDAVVEDTAVSDSAGPEDTVDTGEPDALQDVLPEDVSTDASADAADVVTPCEQAIDCGDGRTCSEGVCVERECDAPGAFCVSETDAAVCSPDGLVLERRDCTLLPSCEGAACSCLDGACYVATECEPGEPFCAAGAVLVCDSTGQGGTLSVECDEASGAVCEDGSCACSGAADGSGEGSGEGGPSVALTPCDGVCTDLQTDGANCGVCGEVCRSDQACEGGDCVCGDGTLDCGSGSCLGVLSDASNCGACGRACPAGQSCSEGECVCPSGGLACGARCVDGASDPSNCGACGTICALDQECKGGECTCLDPDEELCGRQCVDLQTNPLFCGACDNPCPAGVQCIAGECVCPAGLTLCGARCVDTSTDEANCGGCGVTCEGTCSSSRCEVSSGCECPALFSSCPAILCPTGRPCCMPIFPGCLAASDDELRRECL